MNRRILAGLAVGGVLIGGAIWWLPLQDKPPLAGNARELGRASGRSGPPPGAAIIEPDADGVYLLPGSEELSAKLHQASRSPAEDIEVLAELLANYRQAHDGENPIAPNNRVVVAQLQGQNEQKRAVLPESGVPGLTGGELRDRWGTPYFFHALSARELEILSAGPDRKLHTEDDVRLDPASSDI